MTQSPRAGTAIEYGAAYTGIFFLLAVAVGMLLSAFQPEWPPFWIGGFIFLVPLVASVRQVLMWEKGAPASRFLDPIRSRLGLRTLPTLAWFFAAALPIVGLFALRNATMEGSSLGLDAIDQLFVMGAFLATTTLEVVLCRRSDRRDRDAGIVGRPGPAGRALVQVGGRVSELHRRLTWILPGSAAILSLVAFGLSNLGSGVGDVFGVIAVVLLVAWVVHSQFVIKPRLREIEREEAAKEEEAT
jgi:hypothetical protein